MAKLDWHKASQRDAARREPLLEDRRDRPTWIRKPAGITNAQAKYLAALCRQHGLPYKGQGMTRAQASTEITRLLDKPKGWREPKANNRAARRATGQPKPIEPYVHPEAPTGEQVAQITQLAAELGRNTKIPATRDQAAVRITQLQAQRQRRQATANNEGSGGHKRRARRGTPRRKQNP